MTKKELKALMKEIIVEIQNEAAPKPKATKPKAKAKPKAKVTTDKPKAKATEKKAAVVRDYKLTTISNGTNNGKVKYGTLDNVKAVMKHQFGDNVESINKSLETLKAKGKVTLPYKLIEYSPKKVESNGKA